MAQGGKTSNSGKAGAHAARRTRLAAALRENLKRRKQQARQRALAHKTPARGALPHEPKPGGGAPDFRRNRDEE